MPVIKTTALKHKCGTTSKPFVFSNDCLASLQEADKDFRAILKVLTLEQKSSDHIISLTLSQLEELSVKSNCLGAGDALIVKLESNRPLNLALGLYTADCLPIILETDRQLALIHAGWRGLAAGIIEKTLNKLDCGQQSGSALSCYIGPAARGCCYEVGTEVLEALGMAKSAAAQKIDLNSLAEQRIQKSGYKTKILADNRCTICNPELHSFRRDKTGQRNLTFVLI